ncbi:MAG: DNA polymerase I [bacterium]|nr:DNA polymerase I [bacterium]
MKTLWLVDGTSLAYRSFFAFIRNPLRNSKGENTSAVFGFVNSLLKLLNEKKPEYLLVSFDSSAPSFRHKQFKEYKATRPKAPPELVSQLPVIKEIVKCLGIQLIEEEGIEADDVIGTIAKKAHSKGFDVIIFSDDKDFLQLEFLGIKILSPRSFEFVSAQSKLGIPSQWVTDFLGLTGDTIDNIPGVPGIGNKTATKLISQFGSLKDIFENISKIESEKVKSALNNFKEQALLSKELATIQTEASLKIEPNDLKIGVPDNKALFKILTELEFFSIIKKLTSGQPQELPLHYKPEEYKVVTDLAKFLKSVKDKVSIVSFGYYFSLANEKGIVFVGKGVENVIVSLVENPSICKIVPDSKSLFKKFDIKGNVFDLSIADYLLKPELKEHSIDNIALTWLGFPLSSLDTGKGKKNANLPCRQAGFTGIPDHLSADRQDKIVSWLMDSAFVCYPLYNILKTELESKGLISLFTNVEIPLARVLSNMERIGVLIDKNYFLSESSKVELKLNKIEAEIYSLSGERFNLRSPIQLSNILFDKLNLPKSKRKKTGYSTDQDVLTELAKDYELPRKILEYRDLFKLKSTYLDAIPLLADSYDRVHTNWQQTGTATGRLSSSNPNLQNIPKREIRMGFIAHRGWRILSADYSQIELRILASVSKDSTLIEAFNSGADIHTKTASLIFNIPESRVSSLERDNAKVVNFGIIYGMGPYGLSQRLGINVDEASTFIAAYFLTYPGVKQWIDKDLEFARKTGYVETLLGRKRWIEGINSDNVRVREFAERAAINAPIQGSAADMIKVAMIRIYDKLHKFKSRIIMQVHDELVFEVPEEEVEDVKSIVEYEMKHALPLEVPVVVRIGVGDNWYELR